MFFGSILPKFHLLPFFGGGERGRGGYVKIYNEFAKQSKIKILKTTYICKLSYQNSHPYMRSF